MGTRVNPILSLRKRGTDIHGQQNIRTINKRNRCNKQYSARLTRWLDRLTHFDISVQHIAYSNLKVTDCLSKNPVEKYVINI